MEGPKETMRGGGTGIESQKEITRGKKNGGICVGGGRRERNRDRGTRIRLGALLPGRRPGEEKRAVPYRGGGPLV